MDKVAAAGTTLNSNVVLKFSATDVSAGAVIVTVGACPKECATKLINNKILKKLTRNMLNSSVFEL